MSFLNTMTEALALEIKLEGHEIETVCVRMCGAKGIWKDDEAPSRFTPSVEDTVKAALARVGCGKRSLVVYWAQALRQMIVDMLPGTIWEEVVVHNMRKARHWALERDYAVSSSEVASG
jgi:17beta-estradiol 17-dehydrogenase / very-long-chain 3-oxoacyl-CoA reductase